MIEFNLHLIDDNLDELERRLVELSKSESFVGYSLTQGIHEKSGMPYTNLMALMAAGYSPKNLPARPLMLYAANAYPLNTSSMHKDLTKYLSNIASDTLSQSLSGCALLTDSEVTKKSVSIICSTSFILFFILNFISSSKLKRCYFFIFFKNFSKIIAFIIF